MRLIAALILVCVGSATLAGCQLPLGRATPTPYPTEVPALHLPGLSEVPGVLPLLKQLDIHSPPFVTTATLPEPASAGPSDTLLSRTRIVVGTLGPIAPAQLASIALDGSDARTIASNLACADYANILTHDGSWLACNVRSEKNLSFTPTSLVPTSSNTSPPTAFSWQSAAPIGMGAWSPDGERLASPQGCAITVFRVTPARAEVRALAKLVLSPVGSSACLISSTNWSPDGQTLALAIREGSVSAYYLLPLDNLPLNGPGVTDQQMAPVVAINPQQLTNVGTFPWWGIGLSAVWTAASDGLLLVDRRGSTSLQSVVKVTLQGTRTTLFQLPQEPLAIICAVAATADPRSIVLDICMPPTISFSTDGTYINPTKAAYDRLYVLTTS
jgi:hypothetical protein